MLSLDHGKPLLFQIDKDRKKIRTIKFYDSPKKESDVVIDDLSSMLTRYDYKEVKSKFKLSNYDVEILKRKLKKNAKQEIDNSVQLKAYEELENIVNEKLKNIMLFDSHEEKSYELIPAIKGFGVVVVAGVSGAGKSTLVAKILSANRKPSEPILLISRTLREPDPAFKDFEDDIEVMDINDLTNAPSLEDLGANEDGQGATWLIIDDIEGLKGEQREFILELVNGVVCCGRKLKIKVIFSSHLVSGYIHKTIMNEAQYYIVFPQSSKHKLHNELRLKYSMPTSEIHEIFESTKKDHSRYLILGLNHPNFWATKSRVVLN